MAVVDRTGAYIATIAESSYGETKKGFPQYVAKFAITKRFVTEKDELEYFKITEPAWVEWSTYGDEIMGFLVLFNDSGPLKNFEQIQIATGWNGADFQELSTLVGKSVLIRVEDNTWDGKTTKQVNWIDAPDASPERSIKQADAPTIAAANAKWLVGRKAPAKPTAVAALPKAAPAASAVKPPATAAPAAATPAPTTASAAPSTPKTPPGRKPKDKAPAAAPAPVTGISMAEAWESVTKEEARGNVSLSEVEDMWITTGNTIVGSTPDKEVTEQQWLAIRDAVLAEIAAKNK